ncbi:MAG TPA: protease inhibitor I42 family protein [bacterium]|nr:protease inhibitor I42 family protein [bacterium]HPJ72590.1 protease inhibitor I42 family protein [bacterium]
MFGLLLSITVAAAAGPLGGGTGPDDPMAVPTAADSPGTIRVRPGETFVIKLDSNITTGFQWSMPEPPDPGVVDFLEKDYIPSDTGKRAGGGGREEWKFRAAGTGETTIDLIYSRSWELGVPPARTAAYRVVVSGTDGGPEERQP